MIVRRAVQDVAPNLEYRRMLRPSGGRGLLATTPSPTPLREPVTAV